jgi:hypothetical protein
MRSVCVRGEELWVQCMVDREALGFKLLIYYSSSVESWLFGRVEVIDALLHRLVARTSLRRWSIDI